MRASQKLYFVSAIASELERRYSFMDIDTYLGENGIDTPNSFNESKADYVKLTLRDISNEIVLKMIDDLEIDTTGAGIPTLPPKNWENGKTFRLFVKSFGKRQRKGNTVT